MSDIYAQIAQRIIEQQEAIIGPVAIEQARSVPDIAVNWDTRSVEVYHDKPAAIDKLVQRYERLFGPVSVEVCKDATARLVAQLPADKQPKSLR